MAHLESQFDDDMDWDNYGNGKDCWQIDHIVPLWAVDLTQKENVKTVCHFTNLRPLWRKDNVARNRKENKRKWVRMSDSMFKTESS